MVINDYERSMETMRVATCTVRSAEVVAVGIAGTLGMVGAKATFVASTEATATTTTM